LGVVSRPLRIDEEDKRRYRICRMKEGRLAYAARQQIGTGFA